MTNLLLWAFASPKLLNWNAGKFILNTFGSPIQKAGNLEISLSRPTFSASSRSISSGKPPSATPWMNAPFFYSRRMKTHITRQGLAKAFNRAMGKANIAKSITTHSGRRTFASHNEITFAQAMLGHKNRSTIEIYTYVLDEQKKVKKTRKKVVFGIESAEVKRESWVKPVGFTAVPFCFGPATKRIQACYLKYFDLFDDLKKIRHCSIIQPINMLSKIHFLCWQPRILRTASCFELGVFYKTFGSRETSLFLCLFFHVPNRMFWWLWNSGCYSRLCILFRPGIPACAE